MTYEYFVGGKLVSLEEDPDLLGVRYSEPALHSFRSKFSWSIGADFATRFEIPNENFTLLKTAETAPVSVTERLDSDLKNSLGISRAAPVFKMGSTRILATDRILLGLKDTNQLLGPLLN